MGLRSSDRLGNHCNKFREVLQLLVEAEIDNNAAIPCHYFRLPKFSGISLWREGRSC